MCSTGAAEASFEWFFPVFGRRPVNTGVRRRQAHAELNRRLIMRKKVLPGELGLTPMDLMELRHLADYKPQSVTAREAKRAADRAEKFLSSIERALGETA